MMSNHKKIIYRPEIDGLRAIAVIAVMLFHAEFSFFNHRIFSGGFIGVDVFFVISGYLIGLILLQDLQAQTFSFRDFFERRLRRILPLLLTVITLSIPFSWHYLFADEMQDYAASVMSSLFFYSNLYFATKNGYWDIANQLRPLLHSWSLAIEVQFYFTIPVLIFLVHKYKKAYLSHVVMLLALCSICYAHYLSLYDANRSFYLLSTRLWELLSGVLLAMIQIKEKQNTRHKMAQHLPLLGLILIVLSLFYFDANSLHPSFLTLIPILGTALIIHFSHTKSIATRWLQNKQLVKIGVISYGLYVWHFPILVFNNAIFINYWSNYHKLLCIVLSFLLSYITYFVIEKPFRRKDIISSKQFFLISFVVMIVVLEYATFAHQSGFPHRIPNYLTKLEPNYQALENEHFYAPNYDQKIIAVGDSHMDNLTPYLKEYAIANQFSFAKSVIHGCIFITNLHYSFHGHSCYPDKNLERLHFIESAKPKYLIWAARLPYFIQGHEFKNGSITNQEAQIKRYEEALVHYQEMIMRLLDQNITIVLVYPNVEAHDDIRKTIYKKIKLEGQQSITTDPIVIGYQEFKERTDLSYKLLDSIDHQNIIRIYPAQLFCNSYIKNRCVFYHENKVFYHDSHHPSKIAAQMIVKEIFKKISQRETALLNRN